MTIVRPLTEQVSWPAIFLLADGSYVVVKNESQLERVPKALSYEPLRWFVYVEVGALEAR